MTTSYVWCDAGICQARNAGNAVTRAYYGEGEVVPGAPAQRYYYGADQIGSVRRVFASTGGAPAYAYDPYGSALQGTAPLTDFGYAGMFWHADSGLYLTQYRAYDPAVGRWLSRDPIGESSDPAANLYRYVGGNPISLNDFSGLQYIPPKAMQHILEAHGSSTKRTRAGNSVFNPEYSNPAALQQLCKDVFAAPGGPPQPMPYGGYERIEGQVLLMNQQTGQTVPYFIGTAGNGMPTNAVRIVYDPKTGNVVSMYPIEPLQ